jgi:hypothetical protein
MKKQVFKIYVNGHFFESAKTLERAKEIVEREKRRDLQEIKEGYLNPLPVYEIKKG